jgi:DNA repair protein RAD16
VFHKSVVTPESIDGFLDLDIESQMLIRDRVEKSQNEVDQDMVPVEPDELVRKEWDQPVEPSDDLLMPLLPYQKEGLGWMLHQELGDVHGGILADEMGMGKTIQAISLMLSNRPDHKNSQQRAIWDR